MGEILTQSPQQEEMVPVADTLQKVDCKTIDEDLAADKPYSTIAFGLEQRSQKLQKLITEYESKKLEPNNSADLDRIKILASREFGLTGNQIRKKITKKLDQLSETQKLSQDIRFYCEMVSSELVSNIIQYTNSDILVTSIRLDHNDICLTLAYKTNKKEYEDLKDKFIDKALNFKQQANDRIGGLGGFLSLSLADSIIVKPLNDYKHIEIELVFRPNQIERPLAEKLHIVPDLEKPSPLIAHEVGGKLVRDS